MRGIGAIVDAFQGGGYESGADVGKRRRLNISSSKPSALGSRNQSTSFKDAETKALRGMANTDFMRMNCYDRHRKLVKDYITYYGGKMEDLLPKHPVEVQTDFDLLKEAYRFLPEADDEDNSTVEKRMAKKYYDKLFKEYCIGYLSRYKEGKIGMRWRTQQEVLQGKGQFVCGHKPCDNTKDLKSYEVNFAYVEAGEKKQALVKLRVCPDCAYKLNYKKIKKMKKKLSKAEADLEKLEDSSESSNSERRPKQRRKNEKKKKRKKKRTKNKRKRS